MPRQAGTPHKIVSLHHGGWDAYGSMTLTAKTITNNNHTMKEEATSPTEEASTLSQSSSLSLSSSSIKVRVGVRVRPRTHQEIGNGGKSVLHVQPPQIRLGERCFTYDTVFDETISQTQLYQSISEPLLHSFLDGYNATVRFSISTLSHDVPSVTMRVRDFAHRSLSCFST